MINFLKGMGYKFTTKDTLNPSEFRLANTSLEIDEELSTFDVQRYLEVQTIELCLSKRAFSIDVLKDIFDELRNEDAMITATAEIDEQERSYLITFTFSKKEI